MGVKKYKPRHLPHLLEKKVLEGQDNAHRTVASSRKTVQSAKETIGKTEELIGESRELLDAVKERRGRSTSQWAREKQQREQE